MMKHSGNIPPILVAALLTLVVTRCKTDSEKANPLDAYQHITKPVVFAPELAIKENTYKGCFSSDFTEFYFFRENKNNPGREDYRIFSSVYRQGKWIEPQLIGFSDSASDVYPMVSVVDDKFFFTSYRRVPADTSHKTNANFWVTRKTETGWEKPVHLEAANLIYNYNSQPSMAKNGTIYFTSNVPDWSQTLTYKMKFQNGNYSEPEPVEFVNSLRQTDSTHTRTGKFAFRPMKTT